MIFTDSVWAAAVQLAISAAVVLVAGTRMVRIADRLADVTGMVRPSWARCSSVW